MTVVIQFTLDDALLVMCPKCGHAFHVQQAVRDAKVSMLSPATRTVWDAAGYWFQRGQE